MDRSSITPEIVREFLDYTPETGVLHWRFRERKWFNSDSQWKTWNKRFSGKPAMTSPVNGYRQGSIFGVSLRTHRVIWAWVHGEWPGRDIDHINGDRADNRLANLRSVTRVENMRNKKIGAHNTSGVMGVSWAANVSKWRAEICVSGKTEVLGYFKNKEDAEAARKAADARVGFHKNHGRAA